MRLVGSDGWGIECRRRWWHLHIYGSQAVMYALTSWEHGEHVNKIILFKWMLFNWCKRSKIKFISVARVSHPESSRGAGGFIDIFCIYHYHEHGIYTAFIKCALFHAINYIKINSANIEYMHIKCIECVCV